MQVEDLIKFSESHIYLKAASSTLQAAHAPPAGSACSATYPSLRQYLQNPYPRLLAAV